MERLLVFIYTDARFVSMVEVKIILSFSVIVFFLGEHPCLFLPAGTVLFPCDAYQK